jgi:hypothetical protein
MPALLCDKRAVRPDPERPEVGRGWLFHILGWKVYQTLEHNFGHGGEHACEINCLLNLLRFQFHGILQLADEEYRKSRGSFGRRDGFVNGLRFSLRRFLHKSWVDYLLFVIGDEDGG